MIRLLVAIDKKEKDIISKRFPNVFITRTMKQDSKRHHYFMEESNSAMRFLRKLRYGDDYEKDRRRDYDKRKKKGRDYDRAGKTDKRNAPRASQTDSLREARR